MVSGLKIMADQWTMSDQNGNWSGQLLVIMTGHVRGFQITELRKMYYIFTSSGINSKIIKYLVFKDNTFFTVISQNIMYEACISEVFYSFAPANY